MRVDFSKDFSKALDKLSGKIYDSVREAINNVVDANSLEDIQNLRKIETLNSVYRIRIGSKRAFFVLHIEIEGPPGPPAAPGRSRPRRRTGTPPPAPGAPPGSGQCM